MKKKMNNITNNAHFPSWVIAIPSVFVFNQLSAQEIAYQAPDVSIFSEPK